ncbi:MAG: hypothetical protein NVS1B13_21600 [Flavisolibacter sp.]
MKLKEFKYEIKEKKKQLLFDNGIYLATRKEMDYTICLYQIESFYVEAYFYDEFEEVGYMRAFSSMNELDPYLRKIKIPLGLVSQS